MVDLAAEYLVTRGGSYCQQKGMLAYLVWPGNPPTKKTSPQIIQLARDAAGKSRRLPNLLKEIREMAAWPSRASAEQLVATLDAMLAKDGLKTLVLPSPDYKAIVARVVPDLTDAWLRAGGRPLGGDDEPLRIEAHFYLGPRQRPDVSGLYEAAADLLQEAGVLGNDSWIESWDGSRRHKNQRHQPRTELTIWRWEDTACPKLPGL